MEHQIPQGFGMDSYEYVLFFYRDFCSSQTKSRQILLLRLVKGHLNFAAKLTQSLYLKGTILSMIDKRAVLQMYLISRPVSEGMRVLLTPLAG